MTSDFHVARCLARVVPPPQEEKAPTSGTELGLESLASLGQGSVRLGLDRMERALADLGQPERELRALLVAGTNGKGSTCARAASALRAAGYRVGLDT